MFKNFTQKIKPNKGKKIDLSKEKYEKINLLSFKSSFLDFFSIFKMQDDKLKITTIAFILSLFYLYFFDFVNLLSNYFVSNGSERNTGNMIFSVFTAIIYTIFIIFPYFITTYINKKQLINSFKQTLFNARLYFIYFMFIFTCVFILSRFESFLTTYTTQEIMVKAIEEFTKLQSIKGTPTAEEYPAIFRMQDDLSKITLPSIIYLCIEVIIYSFLIGMLSYFSGFLVALKKENKLFESIKNSFMSFFISTKYVIGVLLINIIISSIALVCIGLADFVFIKALFLTIFLLYQAKVINSLFK